MSEELIASCVLYCGWCPSYVVGCSHMGRFFDDVKETFPKGVRKN